MSPVPARFLLFDATGEGWPKVRLPQVVFAGRSNVGKSSLLNALTGNSRLARTSKTPGRTRGIVFFEVDREGAFADLPGYGYAKVSQAERESWRRLVEGYLKGCDRIRKVYLLVDIRRGPEAEERDLAAFLESLSIPYGWVATKADKAGRGEIPLLLARFAPSGKGASAGGGAPIPVSCRTKSGIDQLWKDIRAALRPPARR